MFVRSIIVRDHTQASFMQGLSVSLLLIENLVIIYSVTDFFTCSALGSLLIACLGILLGGPYFAGIANSAGELFLHFQEPC